MGQLDTKICTVCKIQKPLIDFHKNKDAILGRSSRCKICTNRIYNERRAERRDYVNNYERLRRYGLTQEEYDKIWERQNERCGICKIEVSGSRLWAIDHSHESQKVRGILCHQCNLLLGHAKDSIEILEAAARYLASGMELI